MRFRFVLLLSIVLLLSNKGFGQEANSFSNYLFAYFKNNGEDGLHLAFSRDGLKWRALNDDKPYLTPTVGSQKLMRDPCIVQGPDGVFHLVWTTGWRGQDIGIAHSKDLTHWSEQKTIPVMADEPTAMNCWAPEIFYDETGQQYLIFWATTIPGRFPATEASGNNGLNHRIYFTTTKDFITYSKAALFYDDGFNVIDATIVKHDGKFVMFLKDETQNPVKKNLRIAVSDQAAGPYGAASALFTQDWVEGPTAININSEWIVYYDMYRDHKYGAVKSRDLKSWEVITNKIEFPQGARHGTVLKVSGDVLSKLRLTWNSAQNQKPDWFSTEDALRVANNLLLYQRDTGGWPKNTDMAVVLSQQQSAELLKEKRHTDSTFDNGATHSQLTYLAKVIQATTAEPERARFKAAFLKGMDFIFRAQYENGGWPQFYPFPSGYQKHITYNDDAMVGLLTLLRDVARKAPAYGFVDEARRIKAGLAVKKGIECILKTQIVTEGKRTVWCAQHDETTFAPAPARSYEKISLSGSESVGIVRFLMSMEKPDARVVEAVQSAVAWFQQAKLTGIRYINKPDASLPGGYDRVVIPDANASPLWARFYEIGTNRPIFCGRDGVIKYNLAEIEHERRAGYRWYVDSPAELLDKDFPTWRAKWTSGKAIPKSNR
ncbi:MAG: pectate lyase [Acidobacteria bacterium]|nr:pectate lyase [Acidobacteriota bacterium]